MRDTGYNDDDYEPKAVPTFLVLAPTHHCVTTFIGYVRAIGGMPAVTHQADVIMPMRAKPRDYATTTATIREVFVKVEDAIQHVSGDEISVAKRALLEQKDAMLFVAVPHKDDYENETTNLDINRDHVGLGLHQTGEEIV